MHNSKLIDLVVSHNQEASDAALRIVDSVEAHSYFAWADVKAFYSPLVSAEKQISRAFSNARVICIFVGDNYRDTRWCQEEYALGLRSEQDLSIDRVISVHASDSARSLIPSMLADRPTFPFTDAGFQGIVSFLSKLPDHSEALNKWASHDIAGRADLLGRLPVNERTRLIVKHVEYLVKNFAMGQFEQGSEIHALRLGLVGAPPSNTIVHLTPALLMEFAWNWTLDILGKYSVHHLIHTVESTEQQSVDTAAVMPFLRLPALFHQYLVVARERREPPINTETELLSVVDYVLCGLCLLCTRAGLQVEETFRDVGQLLSTFAGSEPRVSRTAAYLRGNLPDIAFPENSVQRRTSIYSLIRAS